MTRKVLVLGYGVLSYVLFAALFGYAIGFLANAVVPKGIDDGAAGPVWLAVLVDAALLGLFAVQHSVMARPWFKARWTRIIPAAIERSTFVLASNLAIGLLFWQWRPLPGTVWSVHAEWARAVLWTLYGAGWLIILLSTIQIGHFDFVGLRQVLARAREKAYVEPGFREPFLYRLVRHPLLVGFLISFWAIPEMSVGRLLFAGASTGYILVAVRFEEHDLRTQLGEPYERYAEQVPRFIPRLAPRISSRPSALAERE